MDLHTFLPAIIAFVVSAAVGPALIPFLHKLKFSQTERQEGVASHLKKAGTPTMGGIIFLIPIAAVGVVSAFRYPEIAPVLFLTLAFGFIGFLDDFLKVVKKKSDGLLPWQKLILEFVVTAVFWLILTRVTGEDLTLRIPFTHGFMGNIGFLAVPLLFFAVLGTVNGVNFTDGVDGLASSVTVAVALFFTVASILLKAGVAPLSSAVAGALMGFLLYNAYPAKVFMGDTGSLALGGFVVGTAYVLHMPLYILIVGGIYLIEIVSVMMQVSYFKLTHGKRIFKMTPIHHRFELSGWSETRVVTAFTAVTVLLCLTGLLGL